MKIIPIFETLSQFLNSDDHPFEFTNDIGMGNISSQESRCYMANLLEVQLDRNSFSVAHLKTPPDESPHENVIIIVDEGTEASIAFGNETEIAKIEDAELVMEKGEKVRAIRSHLKVEDDEIILFEVKIC